MLPFDGEAGKPGCVTGFPCLRFLCPMWHLYDSQKPYTLGRWDHAADFLPVSHSRSESASGSVFALICQRSREDWERWVKQGEPYSTAACDGLDPRGHFDQKKAELEQASTETIKLMLLAGVAKAALEAGLNEEAHSYAEQAHALTGEDRFRNAPPVTFENRG